MNKRNDGTFLGAPSSNAGDEFHELWAARESLRLLDDKSDLEAIKLEGTRSSDKDFDWSVADYILYFGGSTNSEADKVEVKQLKYSAAHPNKKWTVARIAYGENGKRSKSLIWKLAKTFSKLRAERPDKDPSSIQLSLVTNQPICDSLLTAIEFARSGMTNQDSESRRKCDTDLRKLRNAANLSVADFQEFAKVLDLSGSAGSRFVCERELFHEVAQSTEIEAIEVTRRLRAMVNRHMMPESSSEYIDRVDVLACFGVTILEALLPCPSIIKGSDSCIERSATQEIVKLLLAGKQKICLHGAAGFGKTTALSQLEKYLPEHSETVIFDCYGGGSYLDASSLRHRPQDAFVQLCNEIAVRLQMPWLLSTKPNTDYANVFGRRLKKYANLISQKCPRALLLIVIDGADNSEIATQERGLGERSFVHDFLSFGDLPRNVRFIVGARSSRLAKLGIPDEYEKIELGKFTTDETAANARRYWDAPQNWIDDLHELSNGIPRVQGYALERDTVPLRERIEILKPSGKDLNQVFDGIFNEARKKAGIKIELQKFCACISVLPRPIPICEIASVLKIDQEAAKDFCIDLDPGVKCNNNFVTFSDEDIEAYVKKQAGSLTDRMLESIVDRLLDKHETDKYAAINVVPILKRAKSHKHLLDLVEDHPEPHDSVIQEPVIRQEVRAQRLKLAISVCCDAGESDRALKFVLLGAEALKSEAIMRSLLVQNPRLTAKHAKETGSRLILSNPQQKENQGPLLLNLMSEYAENDKFVAVQAFRRQFKSWHSSPRHNLEIGDNERDISDEDAACLLYADLLKSYSNATLAGFRRTLSGFSGLSAKILFQRLAQERRFELMEKLATSLSVWQSTFILILLAMACRPIDHARLSLGLKDLVRRFKLKSAVLRREFRDDDFESWLMETLLTGIEILSAKDKENNIIYEVLELFLDPEVRRIDRVSERDATLLDAVLRCVTLSDTLKGKFTDLSRILLDRPEPENGETEARDYERNQGDRRLREKIEVLGPVYVARAQILAGTVSATEAGESLHESYRELRSGVWQNYHDHDFAMLRSQTAYSLSVLLRVQAIKEDVMTAIWIVYGNQSLLNLPKIAPRLQPHEDLHEPFHKKVCEAEQVWLDQSTGSYDKSQNLMELAELLLPVSADESLRLFNQSVKVAGDISSEIGDVIRLLNDLVHLGFMGKSEDRSEFANALTRIVEDAYRRVKYQYLFPWREALSAISRLDASIALACLARWHDQGNLSLKDSLPTVVHVATSTNQISCSVGHALLVLAATTDTEDLEKLIDVAEKQGSCEGIAAEVGADLLSNRIDSTGRIKEFVSQYEQGSLSPRVKQFLEFHESLPKAKKHPETVSQHRENRSAILGSYRWSGEDLCSGKRLKARADAILRSCQEKNQHFSLEEVLQSATNEVTFGKKRTYLEALMELQEEVRDEPIVNVICDAVNKWRGPTTVLDWFRRELPRIIAFRLTTDFDFRHRVDEGLSEILELSGASGDEAYEILLNVIQRVDENLDAQVTLAIARIMVSKRDSTSAASLFKWYFDRLLARIPNDSGEMMTKDAVPFSKNEAIARFIYAFLGDIDLRIRWRAAHAIRRLARLGEGGLIKRIWQEWTRTSEPVFRDYATPFYWIAARLWLVIALHRVSTEAPKEIASLGRELYGVATCNKFPHVLIKAYAREATVSLFSSGLLSLASDEFGKLEKVNQSPLPRADKDDFEEHPKDTIDLLLNGRGQEKEHWRFHFDRLDTLRYWYEPWTRIFHGLSKYDFQKNAESWIIDKWGYTDNETDRAVSPRMTRIKRYDWALTTNSHGNLPTVERYSTHLEWHAMWCVVGELLSSYKLSRPTYEDEDYDGLANKISSLMISHPPTWLSDIVGVRPLQLKYWQQPKSLPTSWLSKVDDKEFISELMPADCEEYLVVHANIETEWRNNREVVKIFSSLVSPQTAHSLVNALQTARYLSDYYLGPEGGVSDITEDGFELRGWLLEPTEVLGFDSKDSLCQDIGNIAVMPGTVAQTRLGLTRTSWADVSWYRTGHDLPSFVYESWGNSVCDDKEQRNGDEVASSGHRLLVRRDDLAKMLKKEKLDLIVEVGVTRSEPQERTHLSGSESDSEVTFARILLLRGDGEIEGAERNFGTWRKNLSRTED